MCVLALIAVLLTLVIVMVVMTLSSDEVGDPVNGKPASSVRGYYASNQSYVGGEEMNEVVLEDMSIDQEGKDVVLRLTFTHGNTSYDGQDVRAATAVPYYDLQITGTPRRLALYMEDIVSWAFTAKSSWQQLDLLNGVFISGASGMTNPTLYVQLTRDVAYKVSQEDGDLVIRLRPLAQQNDVRYYALLNAATDYAHERALRTLGMQPTLCADKKNTLLISESFQTQAEAEAFAAQVQAQLGPRYSYKKCHVVQLAGDALPPFDGNLEMEEIQNKPVLYQDGQPKTAEVLEVNARLLAIAPDGATRLFATPVQDIQSGEQVTYEALYTLDAQGQRKELVNMQFGTMLVAQYAPDGRHIAFIVLDTTQEMSLLYLYALDTGELTSISQEGFGSRAWDFVWSPDSAALYGMTASGKDEEASYQIQKYDLTAPQQQRVSTLTALEAGQGMLGIAGDTLYYSEAEQGADGAIYRLRLADGARAKVADGTRFILSADGAQMAVTGSGKLKEAEDALRLYRTADWSVLYQMPGVHISDFAFCAHGQLLFLTNTADTSADTASALYRYAPGQQQASLQFGCSVIDFVPDASAQAVVLNETYGRQGVDVPVAYRAPLH
nr:hypothetical protein [Maliibacterium massiliense]